MQLSGVYLPLPLLAVAGFFLAMAAYGLYRRRSSAPVARQMNPENSAHDVSERMAADQALRQSEERHRALIEHATDIVMVLDREGVIQSISPSSARILGYQPDEMVGTSSRSYIHPDDLSRVMEGAFAKHLLHPGPHPAIEVRIRHKDGSWRSFEGLANNLLDNPAVAGVVINARDITERKCAEAALQQRLAMETIATQITARLAGATADDLAGALTNALRTIGEFVGVQCCYVLLLTDDGATLDHRYEWLAPTSSLLPITFPSVMSSSWAIAQLRRFQIVDVPDVNLLPPEAQSEQAYWQASGARSALALPLVVGNRLVGTLGFSAEQTRPVWADEDVRLLKLTGEVLANALARARFEQALRASEDHLRLLNDQLEDQVAQRTAELVVVNAGLQSEICRRAETEQALQQSKARNQALLQAIPDVMWVVTPTGVLVDCRAGEVGQDPFLGCRSDNGDRALADFVPPEIADQVIGQVRAALDSGYVQRQEFQITDGERLQEYEARTVALPDDQALVMLRNISEQKQFERQLLRTERLAALGQLAASMAHEINNPLQIIQSHLDLVLDFPLGDAEKQEYLQVTRQQVTRLSRLVADVLDLARPQAQRVPVVTVSEPAEVADVVQRVLALASKRLRQGEIQVVADLTSTSRALIPSDQLMQVCLNLVVNTIEALQGRRNGRLQITVQQTDGTLTLSFSNNGAAIPPDVLPHIWEPFYTTKPAGSGLGLWVCYNVLRKYGGALNVRNLLEDQGVVFEISLPVAS